MRFIRDIINEKRGHPSPEEPQDDHFSFAPQSDIEAEPAEQTFEQAPHNERPQSLGQGQIDESALRNIFMDAEPIESEPPQPVDTAPDQEMEVEPEAFDPYAPRGSDLTPPSDTRSDHEYEQDQGWPHDERPVQNHADASRHAPMPEAPVSEAPAPRPVPNAPAPQDMSAGLHADAAPVEVPQPAAGRSVGRSGRVKTRVLGFGQPQDPKLDVFKAKAEQTPQTPSTHPVGWLVVVDGPGQGSAFTLHDGVASIGRGEDQTIALVFGDNSISRENHAAIAYDEEQRSFFLGHGGKTNLVRLNGRPVLSTEELKSDDLIRIGETTLRFVALCGATFSWSDVKKSGAGHVAAE